MSAPADRNNPPAQTVGTGVEFLGFATALFFPVVGLLIGLFTLGKTTMAGWIIGLSLASFVFWYFAFTSGEF